MMNIIAFYQVVILALATAAISVTISKAQVFASVREWISAHNTWLGKLVSCSYCTSHWVAFAFIAIYRPVIVQQWFIVDLFVSVFTLVAISALISGIIIKLNPFRANSDSSQITDNSSLRENNNLNNAFKR